MNLSSDNLRDLIINMGAVVEKAIALSTDGQTTLEEIFVHENEINRFHKEIDDSCFKYIALKTPHAKDLRTAIAAMKMNSELERIGDQAVNIKRYAQNIGELHSLIKGMTFEVTTMVRRALDAFVDHNLNLATDVIHHDQKVNEINQNVIAAYIAKMKNGEVSFEEGFSVIRIAKNLERMGDHATNIAEDIIFLESGNDIRHNPAIKFGRRHDDFKE
jgi:phosphate transport system protein